MLVCSIFYDIEALLNCRTATESGSEVLQCIRIAVKSRTLPSPIDLLQFCVEIQLDFFRTLALILKREWEEHFELEQINGFDTITCHRLSYLSPTERFMPDTKKLYALFENSNQWTSRTGFCAESFDALIQSMVLSQLHLAANGNLKVEFFAEYAREKAKLLSGIIRR